MDARTSILAAYDEFKHKLEEFVGEKERQYVDVFESGPGVLWANIGTDKFRGVPSTNRQKMIWEYLNRSLSPDSLPYCWGVQCMDVSEFRESIIPRTSASIGLSVRGADEEDASHG